MAYSTSNPPYLIATPIGSEGGRKWMYRSSDSSALVDNDGYITNGKALGMRVGDSVEVGQRGTPAASSYHTVVAVNSDGSVDLSNNSFVSGSQDTD